MGALGAMIALGFCSIQYTVFFYVCISFCLRGSQEQRDLSWQNFKCFPDNASVYNENTYYEYTEFISKNNLHRFRDIHVRNKCVKAYDSSERLLQDKDTKVFYIRPLEKTPVDPSKACMVCELASGINTLNGVLSKICEMITDGNVPKYTNHSLRATAASCLFEKGVPEKIIAEQPGHRSLARLCAYERTTDDQYKAVCSVIYGSQRCYIHVKYYIVVIQAINPG